MRKSRRNKTLKTFLGLTAVAAGLVAFWFWPETSARRDGRNSFGSSTLTEINPSLLSGIQAAGGDGQRLGEAGSSGTSTPAVKAMTPPATGTEVASVQNPPAQSPLSSPESAPAGTLDPAGSLTGAPLGSSSRPAAPDPERARTELQAGQAAHQNGEWLRARDHLNNALQAGLPLDELNRTRTLLTELAEKTIFGGTAQQGDPLVEVYKVRPGDTLGRLAKQCKVTEELLARVNRMNNKHLLVEGRRIRLIKGPFHALVSKSDHLMHIYLQDVYVRTFRVALGADGGTPTGRWKVINRQENPGWVDPRTGQRWHPDDPGNPIGEFWLGLEGIEGEAINAFGFGIHGTIEPETIGQDVSLGCIRLNAEDIAEVYRYLLPGESLVNVTP